MTIYSLICPGNTNASLDCWSAITELHGAVLNVAIGTCLIRGTPTLHLQWTSSRRNHPFKVLVLGANGELGVNTIFSNCHNLTHIISSQTCFGGTGCFRRQLQTILIVVTAHTYIKMDWTWR